MGLLPVVALRELPVQAGTMEINRHHQVRVEDPTTMTNHKVLAAAENSLLLPVVAVRAEAAEPMTMINRKDLVDRVHRKTVAEVVALWVLPADPLVAAEADH